MADITSEQLFVNHVEIERVNWGWNVAEVLGGPAPGTFIVQDRTNSWEPEDHWDIQCIIRDSGWKLFRGEIVGHDLITQLGVPWRSWRLRCTDYNNQPPQRKVGAFDGRNWMDIDKLGDYVMFDKHAQSLETDSETIAALFDYYLRVDGEAFDTAEHVHTYLTNLAKIEWQYTDLAQCLAQLAALSAKNVQDWVDPDFKWHHVAIPAWQDLLQDSPFEEEDSIHGGGMPEGVSDLQMAPYEISDEETDDPNIVGADAFEVPFDGANMPEQVYVRGSTGFSYNAPPSDSADGTVVVDPESYGYDPDHRDDILLVTTNASTKIWHKGSNGLISSTFDTIGSGIALNAKFIAVPYNPANGKGGHFWQVVDEGPYLGKLFDNDTNYFGYGDITVTLDSDADEDTAPTVGIGGSGWTNDDLSLPVWQDPNKRQAYLEAPISDTKKIRDQVGGQAEYRGKFPTLRWNLVITGKHYLDGTIEQADGWRAGQLVKVTDSRMVGLTPDMYGKYFVIQGVQAEPLPETGIRKYTLTVGDGPTSRYTYQRPPSAVLYPPPVQQIVILERDLAPGPNATQIIVGQLVNKEGAPWRVPNRVVKWTLEVYNKAGTLVTGQGTLTPKVSATDAAGRARTKLRTGSQTGLVYFIFANVEVK